MKAFTLKLSSREQQVLEELALSKELSQSAILRQALALYQLVDYRLSQGERLFIEGDERREILPLILPNTLEGTGLK